MHRRKYADIFHRMAKAGITQKNYMSTTFNTISNLPFIYMKDGDAGTYSIALSSFMVNPGFVSVPADLYETCSVQHISNSDKYLERAALILTNRIAQRSRRGVGNILFVPDSDHKDFFENSTFTQRVKDSRVVIDRSLQPNELRCALWRIMYDGKVLNGGVQFTPKGGVMAPNASAYFSRCFL